MAAIMDVLVMSFLFYPCCPTLAVSSFATDGLKVAKNSQKVRNTQNVEDTIVRLSPAGADETFDSSSQFIAQPAETSLASPGFAT
jgi:hypothetical protein